MCLVQFYIYLAVLLLCVTTVIGQTDGCFLETFNDIQSSDISTECGTLSPWTFAAYSSGSVEQPTSQTSNGFIIANKEALHCVASNYILNAIDGSEVKVTYFATGAVELSFLFVSPSDGGEAFNVSVPVDYNRWTTFGFNLETGEYQFEIIGFVTEDSSVIIDSVTYVKEPGQIGACLLTDSDPDDENENGFYWQTWMIVLIVVGGIIIFSIFGVLFYIWGRRSIETSVEPIEDLEKTVPHIPRAHYRPELHKEPKI